MSAGAAAAGEASSSPAEGAGEEREWWALQRQPTHGWATFLCVLPVALISYGVWLAARVGTLVGQEIHHEPHSSIDARWLHALQPALYIPATIVWAYVNWVGWQFFHHN